MFRIRQVRLSKGVTQERLAEAAGITRIYLSEIENGRADNPSFSLLRKIASVLGVRVKDLLDDDEPATGTEGRCRKRKF